MRVGVAALAVLLVAGCGSRGHGPPLPALGAVCGASPAGLHASTSWIATGDGARLYAASAGAGDRVVVLAHESGSEGLCGWLPTMRFLAAHGFRALAFDFRDHDPSTSPADAIEGHWDRDLQAAIDAAHAKHLALVGASFGGAAVMAYGPKLDGVDAIVSVSGEEQLPGPGLDALANVPRLRVPFLVIASRYDLYLNATQARELVRRAGSSDKSVAVFPGALHGWQILDATPAARRLLLAWLTRRLR